MGATTKYREDHEEFLRQVKAIEGMLTSPDMIREKAKEISTSLAKFSGVLKLHLAMEDNSLYPNLAKSPDPTVQNLALKFQREMGDIKASLDAYMKKWLGAAAIAAQAEGFKADTTQIFKALGDRIRRENSELYAAADKVSS